MPAIIAMATSASTRARILRLDLMIPPSQCSPPNVVRSVVVTAVLPLPGVLSPVRGRPLEPYVSVGSAADSVATCIAFEQVVSGPAVELVVAATAFEGVVAGAADQLVVAGAAVDLVMPA